MYIKKRALIPFLLIMSLILFTACRNSLSFSSSSANTPNVPMGAIWNQIGMYLFFLRTFKPNTLFLDDQGIPNFYVTGENGVELYTCNKDNKYSKQDLPWADSFNQSPYEPTTLPPTSTGDLYFIGSMPTENRSDIGAPVLCKLVNNVLKEVPIKWEDNPLYIQDLAVSKQNKLLALHKDQTLRQYNLTTGKLLKKYTDQTFFCMTFYQNTVIALSQEGSSLSFIDADTLMLTRTISLPCFPNPPTFIFISLITLIFVSN